MVATKKRYEAPRAQLIQFDGKDIITSSSEQWWYNCSTQEKGNYRADDWDNCSVYMDTDNFVVILSIKELGGRYNMREQVNEEMLEEITGGAMSFRWDAKTQTGTVSSNITGQTFTFGRDKVSAVYSYVKAHYADPDDTQMNAIQAIIG